MSQLVTVLELPESVDAPVKAGDVVGKVSYMLGDQLVAEKNIVVSEDVRRLGFLDMLQIIFSKTTSMF